MSTVHYACRIALFGVKHGEVVQISCPYYICRGSGGSRGVSEVSTESPFCYDIYIVLSFSRVRKAITVHGFRADSLEQSEGMATADAESPVHVGKKRSFDAAFTLVHR